MYIGGSSNNYTKKFYNPGLKSRTSEQDADALRYKLSSI